MSDNIINFKVRTVHLALPADFDFQRWQASQPESTGKRWCHENPEEIVLSKDHERATWTLSVLGKRLSGTIADDGTLIVTTLQWTDICSGGLYFDVLLPLFTDFGGDLSVLVVWDGGESIVDLTIVKGVVSEVNQE